MYFIHKIGTVKLIRQEKYICSLLHTLSIYCIYTHFKIGHCNKKKPKCSNKQVMIGYICNVNTDVKCFL